MTSRKDLIGYCGLYCGDCPCYKGEIANLARDLRKKLRESKFDRASPFLAKVHKGYKNYKQCYEVLGLLMDVRCKKVCRKRVKAPACEMRKCCLKKSIQGCWECEEFEICKKSDWLKPVHGDAHIKNLRRIKRHGMDGFLEGRRDW
jgi:hypothetical protein